MPIPNPRATAQSSDFLIARLDTLRWLGFS